MSQASQVQHTIDPNGDTIIILRNPCREFAVWKDEEVPVKNHTEVSIAVPEAEPQASDDGWGFTSTKRAKGKKGKKATKTPSRHQPAPLEEPGNSPESVLEGGESSSFPDPMEGSSNLNYLPEKAVPVDAEKNSDQIYEIEPSIGENDLGQELDEDTVIYRVSSRHLALSSGYFSKALSKAWPEGRSNDSDGQYQLNAYGWDSEAFLVLLNVLHLKNYQVPEELTLDMLAKIAVLVDYYRCQEAIARDSKRWIEHTRKVHPVHNYDRNLVLWMWVAWVFKLKDIFESTTKIALKECTTAVINTLELPIPPSITGKLENSRYQLIDDIVSACHVWIDKFKDGDYKCARGRGHAGNLNYYCGSVLLGSLIKETQSLGFYSPRPQIPFLGCSVAGVESQVKSMVSPGWCSAMENASNGYYYELEPHACTLQNTVVPGIETLVSTVSGLTLDEFKDRAYD